MYLTSQWRKIARVLCLSCVLSWTFAGPASSADVAWDGDAVGTVPYACWDDADNWVGNLLPGSGDVAVFESLVTSTDYGANEICIYGDHTISGLEISVEDKTFFTDSGSSTSYDLTIGADGIDVDSVDLSIGSTTAANSIDLILSSNQTWTNSGTGTLTIHNTVTTNAGSGTTTLTTAGTGGVINLDGVIGDGGSGGEVALNITGSSIVNLNTANTFTGGTTVDGGQVNVLSNTGLGTDDVELTGTGATVTLTDGLTVANNFTFSATGGNKVIQLADAGAETVTLSGNFTVNEGSGSRHADILTGDGDELTLSGQFLADGNGSSDGNRIAFTSFGSNDGGRIIIQGDNDHDGTILDGSDVTVRVEHDNALGRSAILRQTDTVLELASGLTISPTNGIEIENANGQKQIALIETGTGPFASEITADIVQNEVGANNFDFVTATNNTLTVSGVISGDGGVDVIASDSNGVGTVVLSGDNSYLGETIVSAGTLEINGNQSSATGDVTIDAGATLAGVGTIGGDTTISGTHAPGTSPGIQTFTGDLTYNAGADIDWELDANTVAGRGTDYDGIDLDGGTLDFSGSTSLDLLFNGGNVLWSDTFWTTDQIWNIYTGAATVSNFGNLTFTTSLDSGSNAFGTGNTSDGMFSLEDTGTGINLLYTVTPVPEPSALALVGIGLLGLGGRRRRRK